MTSPAVSLSVLPLRRLSGLAAALALAGCAAVGPDYVAPKLSASDVPAEWTSASGLAGRPPAPLGTTASGLPWWEELADPLLDELVEAAFASSPTLEAALAKLEQSRAQSVQAGAAGQPTLDGSAGGERASGSGSGKAATSSWLSTNASWEIDLFGAVRRGREGAQARFAAQQATLADARVSLAADVSDAYLGYRACQSRVALAAQDVASRAATEQLTAASVREGFMAPYQAIRSTASVAEARTQLAATHEQCERLENLLTRLSGVPRASLMHRLAGQPTGLDRLPVPRHFSIAIPQEALHQRPDIRAAERAVAAASADIGLAEADRYPRLTLNGALGYSVNGSGGGALSFGTWSFGPSLSLPLFDGGRRQAAVAIARSRYDEALANFRQATRGAIQEVEDALTRYAAAHERAESAYLSAAQYEHYFAVVERRYREGASNLLELEDARRVMLAAQQTLLAVRQERLQAWVALNRASGGAARYQDAAAPAPAAEAVATPVAAPQLTVRGEP